MRLPLQICTHQDLRSEVLLIWRSFGSDRASAQRPSGQLQRLLVWLSVSQGNDEKLSTAPSCKAALVEIRDSLPTRCLLSGIVVKGMRPLCQRAVVVRCESKGSTWCPSSPGHPWLCCAQVCCGCSPSCLREQDASQVMMHGIHYVLALHRLTAASHAAAVRLHARPMCSSRLLDLVLGQMPVVPAAAAAAVVTAAERPDLGA